jgi:hypothetical protein
MGDFMTLEETRKQIIEIFEEWPTAKIMRRSNTAGYSFFIWLQTINHSILADGNFGEARDPHNKVSTWIDEYIEAEK